MGESDRCRVVLVRHGETEQTDVVAGHVGCPGLSDAGREQARRLAGRVGSTGELGDAVVLCSSELRRAIETAELVATAVSLTSVARDCGLCELHEGVVDGEPVDEVIERYWRPRSASPERLPWNPNAPKAESIPDLVARASATLWRLVLAHPGETVVAVTHGGVIRSSFICFGEASFRTAWTLLPANTSITEWSVPIPAPGARQFGPDATAPPARLERFNDVSHLR